METEKPTASQKLNNWHLLTTKRSISREEPRSPVNPKTLIKGFNSSMKLLDARVNGMPRNVTTHIPHFSFYDKYLDLFTTHLRNKYADESS